MINVLVIEDNKDKISEIKCVLESNNIEEAAYVLTNNVQDGLKHLRESKFDILILDLQLPLRHDSQPKENAGINILYKLFSELYLTPTYIIGLTQYTDLLEKYLENFRNLDFNVFDYNNKEWHIAIESKIRWIISSQKKHLTRKKDKDIYVLTHGIMTSGKWQENIELKLKNIKPNITVIKYTYCYYSALLILFPFLHSKMNKNYERFIKELIIKFPNARIHFISHSFGTFLTINTLYKGTFEINATIGKIILCGSVLKSSYDISSFINKCQPELIVNECGIKDIPLILSSCFVWGLGNAGRNGFYGHNALLKNRYFDGGHSYFFKSDSFMDEYWLPLLLNDKFIDNDDRKKTGMSDFLQSALNLLPQIIIVVLIICFLFAIVL